MSKLQVGVNGATYTNVASMTPEIEESYDFNVTTMDGRLHKLLAGRRTNWRITFYNRLDATYYELRDVLRESGTVSLTVPLDGEETETSDYYASIESETAKGYTMDGTFYFNGLVVLFERVAFNGE